MKAFPQPPLWVMAALAAVAAALLLSVFVDTLHAHVKRGTELRLAQSEQPVNPGPEFLAALAETSPDRAAQLRLR